MRTNINNKRLYLFSNDNTVYDWLFNSIETLVNSQSIDEIFLIDDCSSSANYSIAAKPSKFINILFYLDGLLAKCSLTALKRQSLSKLVSKDNSKIVLKKLSSNEYLSWLDAEVDASAIAFNTCEFNLEDEILKKSPMSVYSVFIGIKPRTFAPLTGIFEFISGDKTITSGIQLEQPQDKENLVLFSSTTSIEPPSICRTLQTCLQKTSVFLPRFIENEISQADLSIPPDGFKNQIQDHDQTRYPLKEAATAINFQQSMKLFTYFVSRIGKRVFDRLSSREQWILLLGKNAQSKSPNLDLSSFVKIIPPENQFWADPFLIEYNNRHYVFLEVFLFERELGHLSCFEVLEDGSYTDPVTILERPYHLSYPNIFEYEGEYYMIPESGDHGTVELYKSTAFPYEWKFEHNLIDNIRAYDSTLLFHEGLWWLFAAVAETEACPTTEELYVFYAKSPLSQNWTPHANNPIVSDAASARPAGKIFKQDNKIIRPSQNCAGSYGAGINFCEILTLTKKTYKEKIIKAFTADWDKDLTGVHTFNFDHAYTVSDAMFKRGKWS